MLFLFFISKEVKMETMTTKWWNATGFKELNKILIGGEELIPIRLANSKIGNVPLRNLISVPNEIDTMELAQIISSEGIPAVEVSEQIGRQKDVLIKI